MKKRLLTGLFVGIIAAAVGVVVALRMIQDQVVVVGIICGVLGFLFGLAFKFKAV